MFGFFSLYPETDETVWFNLFICNLNIHLKFKFFLSKGFLIKNLIILSLELLSICITTSFSSFTHFRYKLWFNCPGSSSAKMAIFLCTFSEQLTKLASLPSVIFVNLVKENRPWTSQFEMANALEVYVKYVSLLNREEYAFFRK